MSERQILYRNRIIEAIYWAAGERSGDLALVEAGRGKEITYGELVRRVDTMAGNLVREGMTKGDRALLSSELKQHLLQAARTTGIADNIERAERAFNG